jgi:membrane protein insertase Oxa1/YidC/SpoIIIJ
LLCSFLEFLSAVSILRFLCQLQGTGLSWLFPFVDGHPPIGWQAAGAYLVLPVLLVVSQYLSQKIVSPQSNDPTQQQTQAILKFIPFMIGKRGRLQLKFVD